MPPLLQALHVATNHLSKIVWEKRFLGSPNLRNKCFVSVDGTDLAIQEPSRPVDPRWFSHKLKRAAVRYELAVGIGSGYIVWVNGPFPAGEYSDLTIARLGLVEFLNNNEYYIADGGYVDGNQYSHQYTRSVGYHVPS